MHELMPMEPQKARDPVTEMSHLSRNGEGVTEMAICIIFRNLVCERGFGRGERRGFFFKTSLPLFL